MHLPDARYMLYKFTLAKENAQEKIDEATNILAPLATLHILEKQFESIAQCSHVRI